MVLLGEYSSSAEKDARIYRDEAAPDIPSMRSIVTSFKFIGEKSTNAIKDLKGFHESKSPLPHVYDFSNVVAYSRSRPCMPLPDARERMASTLCTGVVSINLHIVDAQMNNPSEFFTRRLTWFAGGQFIGRFFFVRIAPS